MKAVVAAFNQEKALVGAFSVITNLWMELFQALLSTGWQGVLARHGVDLAVWAHEHSYERLLPVLGRRVVPGPRPDQPYTQPRATVHITTGHRHQHQ